MLMRKRPIRGETYTRQSDLATIKFLDKKGKDHYEVLLDDGKLTVISKDDLMLPTIETKDYERME